MTETMNQKTANGLPQSSKPETGSIAIGTILSTEKILPQRSGASELDSLLQALENGSPEDGALRERLLLHPSDEEKERWPELSKPLAVELFSGLHGWGEGAISEGYRTVGFDIEDMSVSLGITRPKGCHLILRDVRSIRGSELADADLILSSSPCQEFSYRAMPWTRAKALPPPYLGMELFNAQFRIQREAIEAAGHYIPMVVENVRGAQKWVGRAVWNYGSFYLWGDVPALMPHTFKGLKVGNASARTFAERRALATANPDADPTNFWHGSLEGRKVAMNFHEHEKTGKPGRSFQSGAVEESGSQAGR